MLLSYNKKRIKIIGIFSSLCVTEIVFLFLGGISFSRQSYFKEHFENFSQSKIDAVLTLFCILFLLYGILWVCREGFQHIQKSVLVGILLGIMATAIAIPPFLSRDIAAYLFPNKNALVYGKNIFSSPITLPAPDPWSAELGPIWWLSIPTPYGPLFHGALHPVVFFGQNMKFSDAQDIYKTLNAAIFILSIIVVARLVAQLSLPFYTTYLYAFNPALLIQGVLEGHNDIWMTLGILLFLSAFLKKQHVKSILFFLSSVGVKYISVILAPVFLTQYTPLQKKKYIFFFFFFLGGGIYSVSEIFHLPLEKIMNGLASRFSFPCMYACTPFVSLIHSFFGKTSQTSYMLQSMGFVTLYIWITHRFLFKKRQLIHFCFWVFMSLFFVFTSWMTPWYLITVIAISMLLTREKTYSVLMFFLTAYSLFHYVL